MRCVVEYKLRFFLDRRFICKTKMYDINKIWLREDT